MKLMRLLIALGFVVGMAGTVVAAEHKSQQRAFGGITASGTGDGTVTIVSGSAQLITGLSVSCGSSACVFGVYDSSTEENLSLTADGRFELPAAANTGAYVDLSAAPIRTTEGVTVVLSGTANAGVVYVEQATP